MVSAWRLDYSKSWIMLEYELLRNSIFTRRRASGLGSYVGIIRISLQQSSKPAIGLKLPGGTLTRNTIHTNSQRCTPITDARDRLSAETVGAVEASKSPLRCVSCVSCVDEVGTAQTFDRVRHLLSTLQVSSSLSIFEPDAFIMLAGLVTYWRCLDYSASLLKGRCESNSRTVQSMKSLPVFCSPSLSRSMHPAGQRRVLLSRCHRGKSGMQQITAKPN
ncbi:hypothetical protein DFH29DRAFT_608165 [Suillus ampliporus]|nr:hypothetical protein DFH29DRAFT_608165 [Suillus ampliporus]